MLEFSFEPADYPLHQMKDPVVNEALRSSLAHLKGQPGLPKELLRALLMAEVSCLCPQRACLSNCAGR